MDTSNKFSCFIIGEGTPSIRCAEILLNRGHTIYGMISSDVAVTDWAREREIPHIDPKNKDIVTFLSQHPFDYLFSIVNDYILPQRIVELPRRCAINYHYAPLPRYAGPYATSWAIMQGERVHGITWHAMTELVDGGDIFKQSLFEIADGETALTLNAKCYDAAISSFAELIDDIACDRVSARKQNLNERTFFSRYKKPASGCMLSWKRSARDIGAFIRALGFGPYPNPLGLPKLALGRDVLIVSEIEVLNSMSAVPPGTVTHIDPGFVRVSTIDGEIALRKLLTIDGQPLPIADFVAKFGLSEGYQFKELDQEVATRITAYNAAICQHEAFWTKQLATLENITLPYVHRKTSDIQTAQCLPVPMPVPREMLNPLENRSATGRREDFLLAAFAAYLARIAGVWSFDLGYRDSELASDVADLEGIFAAYVPLHVSMEDKQSFEEVFHAVQEQVKLTKQRKTYTRDIMARYPVLRAKANVPGAHLPSICVERVKTLHDYKTPCGSELTLVIREDGVECLWVYNAEMLDEESVVEMQHGFTAFLQGIVSDPQQRISDLPLLTKAEQYRLLVEWNATQAAYPKDKCVHQLFEAQVERTPKAVAVVFEGEQMTYRELNRRANQLAQLQQRMRQYLQMEKELVLDPAFFTSLPQEFPQISHVRILPKRGKDHNELTQFRYQVILQVGGQVAPGAANHCRWLDWQQEEMTLASLRQMLQECGPQWLGLTHVPNARLSAAIQARDLLRNGTGLEDVRVLRIALNESQERGVEPEEFWQLSEELPYEAHLSWACQGVDGSYDVLLRSRETDREREPHAMAAAFPVVTERHKPWSAYATQPLQAQWTRKLLPVLRTYAQGHLPDYMVPSAFVVLETLPLTPNGKVDRRALPVPDKTRLELPKTFVAPRTESEKVVAGIWSQIFGMEQIGIHDDFIALGGDSLMALQVISHLHRVVQIQLPLARFYEARTIAELSKIIEQVKASDAQRELPSALPTQSSRGENSGPAREYLASDLQRQEEKDSGTAIVAVQTAGSRRPFFFLHGDFLKGAFYCFPLARDLGLDQPFYALEPYNFETLGVPPTFETMATAHLEAVRSLQAEGPYLLGGFCNGGLLAYEMARQLHAQGETVDLLILIDPNLVGHRRRTRHLVTRFGKLLRLDQEKQVYWFIWLRHLQRYLQHVYRYLRFPRYRILKTELDGKRVDQNGMALITLGNEYELWLHHSPEPLGSDEQRGPGRQGNRTGFTLPKRKDLFPEALFPTLETLGHDWGGLYFWITSEYEPGFYPGKSTFFFTKDKQEHGEDVKWRKIAEAENKEVEVHLLAGRHDTCKTIYLDDLIEHLRMCLNKVDFPRDVQRFH